MPHVPLAIDLIQNERDRKATELYLWLKRVARRILVGPNVPIDRVEALRAAFVALKSDPGYRADAEKLNEIDKFISLTKAASPDVVERLTEIFKPATH